MREKIESEIAGLIQKIESLKQEIVLTDGALQAFKWMLAEFDNQPPIPAPPDHLPADVEADSGN